MMAWKYDAFGSKKEVKSFFLKRNLNYVRFVQYQRPDNWTNTGSDPAQIVKPIAGD